MSWRTQFKRGLGGSSPSTPPAASSSAINDVIDALGASPPRVHVRFIETASATTGDNRGSSVDDMTYVNVADFKYRLASLVNGSNNSGRSMGFGSTLAAPAHGTINSLVTTKSCTITLFLQPDRLTTKMVAVTQGLSGSVAGAMSPIEIEDNGAGGYRVRSWVSVGGVARVFTGGIPAIPVGGACVVEYKQIEGTGRFIRVNGALVASNTAFTAFEVPAASPWYVGCWSDGASPFRGIITELVGWDEALSDAASVAIGSRATSTLELSLIPTQEIQANTTGMLDLIALGVCNPDVDWEVEVVSFTANASLTGLVQDGEDPQRLDWTSGVAGSGSATIRLTRGGGTVVSATRTLSFDVLGAAVSVSRCYEGAGGAVTTYAASTNDETVRFLEGGGTRRYNAHEVISRHRWLGTWTQRDGNTFHQTTPQILWRLGAPHNGGCISGISVYSNLTKEIDYDPSEGRQRLYPNSHGGHFWIGASNAGGENFTVENMRSHGSWDCLRTIGANVPISDITHQDSWHTCVRDEVWENDSNHAPMIMRRVLIGDTIGTGPTQSGCHRLLSMTGTNTAFVNEEFLLEDVLWHSSRMRMSGRNRGISIGGVSGFAVGGPMKFQNISAKPRMRMRRCVYMCDGHNYDTLDPFQQIRNNALFIERSNNLFIWTEMAAQAHGDWASQGVAVPSGFTVLEGVTGRTEWNALVADWKLDHPNVRRFNITGISRLYGGTFNLVDTG